MALHVPITERAREEAIRIMQPSTNLINPTDGKMIIEIRHEMALGIYYLTMNFNKPEGPGVVFGSYNELRKAYREGKIGARTKVSVGGLSSVTAGQAMFLLLIPEQQRGKALKAWSSKDVQDCLIDMYRECEKTRGKSMPLQKVSQIIDDIKRLGFESATRSGISIGITDFKKMEDAERIFKDHVDAEVKKGKSVANATIVGWRDAEKVIQKKLEVDADDILGENNPLKVIMASGARAKPDQIRRMMVSVGVGSDVENRLTQPVAHSHLDGLSPQ
jgi:DNA-directed RNA polymerase beta' subunit